MTGRKSVSPSVQVTVLPSVDDVTLDSECPVENQTNFQCLQVMCYMKLYRQLYNKYIVFFLIEDHTYWSHKRRKVFPKKLGCLISLN